MFKKYIKLFGGLTQPTPFVTSIEADFACNAYSKHTCKVHVRPSREFTLETRRSKICKHTFMKSVPTALTNLLSWADDMYLWYLGKFWGTIFLEFAFLILRFLEMEVGKNAEMPKTIQYFVACVPHKNSKSYLLINYLWKILGELFVQRKWYLFMWTCFATCCAFCEISTSWHCLNKRGQYVQDAVVVLSVLVAVLCVKPCSRQASQLCYIKTEVAYVRVTCC